MSVVYVRYTKAGQPGAVLKLNGDPFEILQRVAKEFGVTIHGPDLEFDQIMAEREARRRKAA